MMTSTPLLIARTLARVTLSEGLSLAAHLKDTARATIGDARALWDDVNALYEQYGRKERP